MRFANPLLGMGNPNRGPNIDKLQRKYGMPNFASMPRRDLGYGTPSMLGPKTAVMPEAPVMMPAVMPTDGMVGLGQASPEQMEALALLLSGGAPTDGMAPMPMEGLVKTGLGGANPYTLDPSRMGMASPNAGGFNPMGMYQMPVQQPMPQQRDPRQPQMRAPQQGGQMFNRPFAVR